MADDPAYSLQITQEGLASFHTTLLESIKLVCETAVTISQAEGSRSLERVRIEADSALAVAKVEAESALALAKVKVDGELAIVKAGGKPDRGY